MFRVLFTKMRFFFVSMFLLGTQTVKPCSWRLIKLCICNFFIFCLTISSAKFLRWSQKPSNLKGGGCPRHVQTAPPMIHRTHRVPPPKKKKQEKTVESCSGDSAFERSWYPLPGNWIRRLSERRNT